jgi:hypothetical protein
MRSYVRGPWITPRESAETSKATFHKKEQAKRRSIKRNSASCVPKEGSVRVLKLRARLTQVHQLGGERTWCVPGRYVPGANVVQMVCMWESEPEFECPHGHSNVPGANVVQMVCMGVSGPEVERPLGRLKEKGPCGAPIPHGPHQLSQRLKLTSYSVSL